MVGQFNPGKAKVFQADLLYVIVTCLVNVSFSE